ncbi:MAG: hypothetical protein DLM61_12805 [Pseudonocardiales bacterium]|nr:MAG: hypothetical protein DLM61_12805 [Pseudonocardiales bacterium]
MPGNRVPHSELAGDALTDVRSGGRNPTDVSNTRPGGPNRQERAHRVGAPESLSEAIEEVGMVQVHTCVSVHCDQCGQALGGPGVEAHYPNESAALDAAVTEGWQVGPGGRLWCSACGAVLTCEDEGHQFSAWGRPVNPSGQPSASEYRNRGRCCLYESRPASTDAAEMAWDVPTVAAVVSLLWRVRHAAVRQAQRGGGTSR